MGLITLEFSIESTKVTIAYEITLGSALLRVWIFLTWFHRGQILTVVCLHVRVFSILVLLWFHCISRNV
ncbi:hypothetical protein BDB00DRAFT_829410 [Zychaea mexicana]|uniref:uncharacterized protein n=1 Tax=Zychaea mexicana TaxID=64656 RepID=UPI0022FE6BCB|nr:uncharacterized protein BDB00DRAFT_829410 [Zychaea mexicana]KAI9492162.1 hypothetical protein BDB00DRAFT_829410 [Zychaea mexicana]